MRINGKLVTKAGIIRLLKSEPYGLSDWMARQVYADSLNFFYTQDNVRPQAFANLYAEKAENWANTVFLMGNVKEAKNLLKLAAELRGCYKDQQTEIPEELLYRKARLFILPAVRIWVFLKSTVRNWKSLSTRYRKFLLLYVII